MGRDKKKWWLRDQLTIFANRQGDVSYMTDRKDENGRKYKDYYEF